MPELMLSEMSGMKGDHVIFTSNETPAEEYQLAYKQGNIINLDDITHIDFLKKSPAKSVNAVIPTPFTEADSVKTDSITVVRKEGQQ